MMEYTANYKKIAKHRIFNDVDELSAAFYKKLTDSLTNSLSKNKKFSLALSGGSTPLKLYQYMANQAQDGIKNWDNLLIYWGDERCVPPGDKESNFGNAWKTILKDIAIPGENIHRIRGEANPEVESKRYSGTLQKLEIVNGFPVLDLIILGIGDDGHTASIFPDQRDLLLSNDWVSPAIHPQSGQKRITLTGKLINNAREILFLATGKIKQIVLNHIFNDKLEASDYPAYHIRPVQGSLTWYLDKGAAEKI